jgi:uncharacterized delta-60 repeat protein
MKILGGIAAAGVLAALLAVAAPALGKSRLDPAFGEGGIVTTNSPQLDEAMGAGLSLSTMSNGNLVVLGVGGSNYNAPSVIVRYRQDGSRVRSFGTDGFLIADNDVTTGYRRRPGGWGPGSDLAVRANDRIVATGFHWGDACGEDDYAGKAFLGQVRSNGVSDRGFGTNGATQSCLIRPDRPPYVGVFNYVDLEANSVSVTGGGRTLIAGTATHDRHHSAPFVARYTSRGVLDRSFRGRLPVTRGSRGIVELLPSRSAGSDGYQGTFEEVKSLRKRKILAVGEFNRTFSVVRLNANGRLDRSFARKGRMSALFGTSRKTGGSYATGVAFDRRGRILVAGYHTCPGRKRDDCPVVVRLHRNGTLDRSFGHRGVAKPHLPGSMTTTKIALQRNGRIVVAGSAEDEFTLIRLKRNGKLDRSFFDNGVFSRPLGTEYSFANDVAVDRSGRIIATGGSDLWYVPQGMTTVRILP